MAGIPPPVAVSVAVAGARIPVTIVVAAEYWKVEWGCHTVLPGNLFGSYQAVGSRTFPTQAAADGHAQNRRREGWLVRTIRVLEQDERGWQRPHPQIREPEKA